MSYAPDYDPTVGFATEESNQVAGRSTVRTVALDNELANVSSSINALNTNLKKLQRDDGKPVDFLIEPYAFSEQSRSLMAVGGLPRGMWASGATYAIKDVVQFGAVAYICYTAHTSGVSFVVEGFWIPISGDGQSLEYAQQAGASAVAAADSEDDAAASAALAQTHANTATTKAGEATTAAGSAAASQNAAGTSASSANAAMIAAQNAYDSFDDRFLGSKAAEPTLDNDGNALLTGAIYWHTAGGNPGWRVWSGTAWVAIPRLDIQQTFLATQVAKNDTGAVSATETYIFDGAAQVRKVTLTNAITVTFGAPTGIVETAMYKFILAAGDAAARTFAWNAAYKFPDALPPLTSGVQLSGAYDTITFIGGPSNTLIYDGHHAGLR